MNLTNVKAQALKEGLLKQSTLISRNYVGYAAMLYEAKNGSVQIGKADKPLFMVWGHTSWEEFCEHELQLHFGRANRLVWMHERLVVQCGLILDEKLLVKAKITNLMEIARVVTPSTVNTWLRHAQSLSCCGLRHKVESFMYEKSGRPQLHIYTRRIPEKQYKAFRKTVKLAMKLFELENEGEALVLIAEEFQKKHAKKTVRVVGKAA